MNGGLLGKGAAAQGRLNRLAVGGAQTRGRRAEPSLAEHLVAPLALGTVAAGADQADRDPVADGHVADSVADLGHCAGRLVAVDGWQLPAPGAVGVVDVAVAYRAGGHLHPHLGRPDGVEAQIFDHQRFTEGATHGCSHRAPPPTDPSTGPGTLTRAGSARHLSGPLLSRIGRAHRNGRRAQRRQVIDHATHAHRIAGRRP